MSVIGDHISDREHDRAGDPRTHVYLSLYLVIFGFFVVLVNASEVSDPKSSAALASVKETLFQDSSRGTDADGDDTTQLLTARQSIAQARESLQAVFPMMQFEVANSGKDMRVHMDADSFFYPKTAAVKPKARDALVSLRKALSSKAIDASILVSVPRNSGDARQDIAVSGFDLRRAANVAFLVSPERENRSRLHIGYAPQPRQSLSITLRARDISVPKQTGNWVQ